MKAAKASSIPTLISSSHLFGNMSGPEDSSKELPERHLNAEAGVVGQKGLTCEWHQVSVIRVKNYFFQAPCLP